MSLSWVMTLAGLAGATGVAAGAFGAHALRDTISDASMQTFQTGVLYHLVHAVALLGVAALVAAKPMVSLRLSAYGFVLGIVLFSGSLYALALGGPRWLGPVTPIGGVAFIAAWSGLVWSAWSEMGD